MRLSANRVVQTPSHPLVSVHTWKVVAGHESGKEVGGDSITVAKNEIVSSMGKQILRAGEFGEASPGVQKEERIGDIGAKGNGEFNLVKGFGSIRNHRGHGKWHVSRTCGGGEGSLGSLGGA